MNPSLKRARTPDIKPTIPQAIDQSILISNLNPSQLSIARSNALTHLNKHLLLELDVSDLHTRSSPRKLRSTAHKHLDQLSTLLLECTADEMFMNPPIQIKLKCMTKILNSGGILECDKSDVNEISHLFHFTTINAKPGLPDAFTVILKSILTIHKSQVRDGLQASTQVIKLLRSFMILLPDAFRILLHSTLDTLGIIIQRESSIQIKHTLIHRFSKLFGPIMVLSENVKKSAAAIEWSVKTFKMLLLSHGVAFLVDKHNSAMYKVSITSLQVKKQVSTLMSPRRVRNVMSFATPSRRKLTTATSRDLFDLFTGKSCEGYVYVMDGVCLAPTNDIIVSNRDMFVKRMRVD